MDKNDPRIVSLKQWVDGIYGEGRTTSLSDEEILEEIDRQGIVFKKIKED